MTQCTVTEQQQVNLCLGTPLALSGTCERAPRRLWPYPTGNRTVATKHVLAYAQHASTRNSDHTTVRRCSNLLRRCSNPLAAHARRETFPPPDGLPLQDLPSAERHNTRSGRDSIHKGARLNRLPYAVSAGLQPATPTRAQAAAGPTPCRPAPRARQQAQQATTSGRFGREGMTWLPAAGTVLGRGPAWGQPVQERFHAQRWARTRPTVHLA